MRLVNLVLGWNGLGIIGSKDDRAVAQIDLTSSEDFYGKNKVLIAEEGTLKNGFRAGHAIQGAGALVDDFRRQVAKWLDEIGR